jgi:hypothetical protein
METEKNVMVKRQDVCPFIESGLERIFETPR